MTDPRTFGAWLRRERERREITVRSIADRTKIGSGLLEALERGDVSRWPGGIYRRAFVRSYAGAIGLDADLVVANFERVFPGDPATAAPRAAAAPPPTEGGGREPMRLELAAPSVAGIPAAALRTAGLDLACVVAFALVGLAGAGALGFWCGAAVASLALHLSRVLGLQKGGAVWRLRQPGTPAAPRRAEVLSFEAEQARKTSRRNRARRVLADLSAAASSASLPGRRRAARS